jgi:(E)-4-hydroxy-3-methylbut-2-enyl-diphosphate synthase
VLALAEAGSELVRITVNTREAAAAVADIRARVRDGGSDVPLIGDFHYNGHLLLTEYPTARRALDKYRINPATSASARSTTRTSAHDRGRAAHGKPVRIGVNWGSLDRALLTRLMDENARRAEPLEDRRWCSRRCARARCARPRWPSASASPTTASCSSAKVSDVRDLVEVYRALAAACDYPLHLGLTEAGLGAKGIVASTAALAILLHEGIGDTIRCSLTPSPGGDRAEEVRIAQQILQSLGLRHFSAPGHRRAPVAGAPPAPTSRSWPPTSPPHPGAPRRLARALSGVEELRVAVMGCVVNGPGESKHADIGISLPGTGEAPRAPVYVDGKLKVTLQGEHIAEEFATLLDEYVEKRFSSTVA